jgi:hypothetical protein
LSVNTTFLILEAFDLDLNAKLVYSLGSDNNFIEAYDEHDRPVNSSFVKVFFNYKVWIEFENNFFSLKDWFDIYRNSGELFIKSPIDREIAEKIKLTVFVEDINADGNFRPQISTGLLKIFYFFS